MSKQNKKSWLITLEAPDDSGKILIDEEEFKTIGAYTKKVNEVLEPYDLKYSLSTMRSFSAGRYMGGEGKLVKILKVRKLVRKPVTYETVVEERKSVK